MLFGKGDYQLVSKDLTNGDSVTAQVVSAKAVHQAQVSEDLCGACRVRQVRRRGRCTIRTIQPRPTGRVCRTTMLCTLR